MLYLCYAGSSRDIMIAQRLPNGRWLTYNLANVSGNPLASPFEADNHNVPSVVVDGAGYIHVVANHHNDALRYVRSTSPHDITGWTAPGMIGTKELSVSYPTLLRLPDGRLLFVYRDGGSGNGDAVLNRYDPGTQQWTRIGDPLISGGGDSPYWDRATIDQNGIVHLTWMYRATSDASSNHDICYARSVDGGDTWEQSDGTPYTLPITQETAEIVVAIPQGSGLQNQGGLGVDANGYPHAVHWKYGPEPEQYNQLYHTYQDASGWHHEALTSFAVHWDFAGTGSLSIPATNPMVVRSGASLYVLYRRNDLFPNENRAINLATGNEFVFLTGDYGYCEFARDDQAQAQGIARVVVQQTANGVTGSPWDNRSIEVMELDLESIEEEN